MKNSDHPFFRPLWRRIAIVAVCLVWAAIEFATGTPFWGTLALAFAAYGAWQFLFAYKPVQTAEPEASPPEDAK